MLVDLFKAQQNKTHFINIKGLKNLNHQMIEYKLNDIRNKD